MTSDESVHQRVVTVGKFRSLADRLERDRSEVSALLSTCEPTWVAVDEAEKTIRALRTYSSEIPLLSRRRPLGEVAVALPFNNPLYSLILYSAGIALGGSRVTVRPSSWTSSIVREIYASYGDALSDAGIQVTALSGADFINVAGHDPRVQTLLFTGSFDNLTRIRQDFPVDKGLIYCGSGVSPFVVGPGTQMDISEIVSMIIDSKFYNSGQDCLCTERLYIHRNFASELVPALVEASRELAIGDFGDDNARLTPLVPPIAERARALITQLRGSGEQLLAVEGDGALIGPHLYLLDSQNPLHFEEKFAPILTISLYDTEEELHTIAESNFLFGATVTDPDIAHVFEKYPHLTRASTLIEYESADAHMPFGGRRRSGFSTRGHSFKDGPILFSIETTTNPANPHATL